NRGAAGHPARPGDRRPGLVLAHLHHGDGQRRAGAQRPGCLRPAPVAAPGAHRPGPDHRARLGAAAAPRRERGGRRHDPDGTPPGPAAGPPPPGSGPEGPSLSLWALPPRQLVSTLVDMVESGTGGAAYYADVLEEVVRLAVDGPGGPPASTADFRRRPDANWV